MGSIEMIKSLSAVLNRAVNKSKQHKNSLELQIWNPGLLGAKQGHYPLCYAAIAPTLSSMNKMCIIKLYFHHHFMTNHRRGADCCGLMTTADGAIYIVARISCFIMDWDFIGEFVLLLNVILIGFASVGTRYQ